MDITICRFSIDYDGKRDQVYEIYGYMDKENKKQIKLRKRVNGFWKSENVKCYDVLEAAIDQISKPYIGNCFDDLNSFSDLRNNMKIRLLELFTDELEGKHGKLIGAV